MRAAARLGAHEQNPQHPYLYTTSTKKRRARAESWVGEREDKVAKGISVHSSI
jgi:hypothetical protein